jgi:hypothetical protein
MKDLLGLCTLFAPYETVVELSVPRRETSLSRENGGSLNKEAPVLWFERRRLIKRD